MILSIKITLKGKESSGMNQKKIISWLSSIIFISVGIISISYFLLLWVEKSAEQTSQNKDKEMETRTENMKRKDGEKFHKPADVSIITMGDGKDGHSFISTYHDFYNNTLGWNRIHSADYDEQVKIAKEIIDQIDGAHIQNDKLAKDFATIQEIAESLISEESRETMRTLHRFFHDLDIYLNGYNRASTFGVTEYKGEN